MVFGQPINFYKKFKFLLEIDDVVRAGFQKAGPLTTNVGVVKYREGGDLIAIKDAGLVDFEDIVCERGASDDIDLHSWLKLVVDVLTQTGAVGDEYKKNADLIQQDRDGSEMCRWRIEKAFPTKYMHGEWDNNAEEVVIEQVTLSVFRHYRLRA